MENGKEIGVMAAISGQMTSKPKLNSRTKQMVPFSLPSKTITGDLELHISTTTLLSGTEHPS